MRKLLRINAFALMVAALASSASLAQGQSERPAKTVDLGFDGLTNGAAFKTYKAREFTVRSATSGWVVDGNFGNPAPMIEFNVPADTVVGAAVTVTEAGKQFPLDSIDINSSVAAVNWKLVGKLKGRTLYVDKGQIPNPMGGYVTVANPNASTLVDWVEIKLTGTRTVCCDNPVGLDNIIVEK